MNSIVNIVDTTGSSPITITSKHASVHVMETLVMGLMLVITVAMAQAITALYKYHCTVTVEVIFFCSAVSRIFWQQI